ncbi:AraC-like DNA-binding protein [Litorivivens lipolytica]|uniref:AraC-like DNA-binding protein n=1 Tax=Litorivivens lipolytica TaxID=1524264 RepID=A0A7W4W570_9GAMM|nr:AraC family transcriptional regulator [Litorivivens lipolytica]MBB3047650.1 AraC-like DNA-binding protein [Litorivivens lipolytica]
MNADRAGQGRYGISSDYLVSLSEQAFERGMSVADLLDGTDLEASILLQQDVSVGHESFLAAMRNFCEFDGNFWTALEGGRRMTLSKHGYVGYAAQHSQDLMDAAEKLYRYVSTRIEFFELQRGENPDLAELILLPRIPDSDTLRYVALNFLVCLETLCRQILGRSASQIPSRITLVGPPPETPMPPLPAGSKIEFHCDNYSLCWPRTIIDVAIPARNEDLAKLAEARCESDLRKHSEQQSVSERVALQLQRMEGTLPPLEEIAARLNMSVATLKRRLKAEGRNYQQLKDEQRQRQASRWLVEGRLTVDQIADRLGYSDASNFSKAFKSWTGQSPSAFRQEQSERRR